MAGRQAKVITRPQERAVLEHLKSTRNPQRDTAMFLLSIKAGLRAKEIATLTWSMVTDATGEIADAIALPDNASKFTALRWFSSFFLRKNCTSL